MTDEVLIPEDAETGSVVVPPRAVGVVGNIAGTLTKTRHPKRRRVAVDTNWHSYHNPSTLASLDGMILTTEAIARKRGAVVCRQCYGGNKPYEYNYGTDDGGVV